MLSLFSKNKRTLCPLKEDDRLWMENIFNLGKGSIIHRIKNKEILLPDEKDFPIKYDGSDTSANETLKIVATQMEMNANNFLLTFYDGSPPRYEGDMGYNTVTDSAGNEIRPAAIFLGINKDNNFQICIEASQLHNPENMVAILAHEIGYIKLVYQYKIEKLGDLFIDLFPLYFGLGIFAANAPEQVYKNDQSWGGHKTQGYLRKDLWGYALALFAFMRNEYQPEWVKYLVPEVKKYFKRSEKFIWGNKEIIFNQPYPAKDKEDNG